MSGRRSISAAGARSRSTIRTDVGVEGLADRLVTRRAVPPTRRSGEAGAAAWADRSSGGRAPKGVDSVRGDEGRSLEAAPEREPVRDVESGERVDLPFDRLAGRSPRRLVEAARSTLAIWESSGDIAPGRCFEGDSEALSVTGSPALSRSMRPPTPSTATRARTRGARFAGEGMAQRCVARSECPVPYCRVSYRIRALGLSRLGGGRVQERDAEEHGGHAEVHGGDASWSCSPCTSVSPPRVLRVTPCSALDGSAEECPPESSLREPPRDLREPPRTSASRSESPKARARPLSVTSPPRDASPPYRGSNAHATSPTILSDAAETLSMVSSGVWCQG